MGIIQKLRRSGVLGAGGAGFPTDQKLAGGAEIFIANGAECEPLLDKDHALLVNFPGLIIDGIKEAMAAAGARKCCLAVKDKNLPAVKAVREIIQAAGLPVEIMPLPDIYPAGDEVVLVYETLRRVVPPGGLPGQVGALVNNIETLYNIARAARDEPVTEKFLTVAGWVRRPVNVKVPVGARLVQVLAAAGGALGRDFSAVADGLMMGTVLTDLAEPVIKTSSALIILPPGRHLPAAKQNTIQHVLKLARSACISCTFCSETCPRRLLGHPTRPHYLMRAVGYSGLPGSAAELAGRLRPVYETAAYCAECGVCDLVCPMGLSPRAVSSHIKSLLPGKRPEPGELNARPLAARAGRLMPGSRLSARLGIDEYTRARAAHLPLVDRLPSPVTEVCLRLKQGAGPPVRPVVKAGQSVKKGDVVGEPDAGHLGTALHASIDGLVTEITKEEIIIQGE